MPTSFLVELSGGLELLFGGVKSFSVALEASPLTMRGVIAHVRDHLLIERPELFVSGDSVRPGILVLINEVDWELEGALDASVVDGDVVLMISTLHGG
jgi:ubiquitin related modifier 1